MFILKEQLPFFAIGAIISISLLTFSRFIPLTKLNFAVFEASLVPLENEAGTPVGTRLYIGGFHLHHYFFGIIFILLAVPVFFKYPNVAMILIGLGSVLIIDQLPNIITNTWGASIIQSIG